MIRLAGDEKMREVQFRMIAIHPCMNSQFHLFQSTLCRRTLTLVWNGIAISQGTTADKKMAMRFEQMSPRRRLYRTTIAKTGTDVISTAVIKVSQSYERPMRTNMGKLAKGKYVRRYEGNYVGPVAG